MDEEEQNRYVAQLKEEFHSCDTTGTGYLDKEELSALCHKLSLDAHLPLLLDTLLGPHHYARVNFEEFKEGFVAVLSRSLDFSTSEEESSYLEPVVPEEVKPKFVKGTKRYGRRTQPDRPDSELTADSEGSRPFRTEQKESSPAGVRRIKLRRSTSLESVESLKSDEDTGSHKDAIHQTFEAQGQQKRWKRDSSESTLHSPGPRAEVTDSRMRAVWEELGVGVGGFLNRQELSLVCDHLGLPDLNPEELDALFRKLDTDLDGRVSLREFQKGLFREGSVPAPTSSSTPIRPNPQHSLQQAFEERTVRSTSPSLLSATVGQRLLTRLDEGSGCTSPERVIALWTGEGIRNSRDILQTLDFPLEERVSLSELTLALDNELLVSGNGIHQAALISYKNEIQFLQVLADQACRERDKVKADLEWADRRNLQLVSEVDDRHAAIESLNETKIKGLEQEFRDRLTALRSESAQENEVLLQQVEHERAKLKEEVEVLRAHDASLHEEVCNATQEKGRLEEEGSVLKGKLSETERTISKLQRDLDQLLLDKFGSLDPNSTGLLNQEERFSEIIKEFELQCRALRDRNDELNSEVDFLKSQGIGRRSRQERDTSTHAWSSRRSLTTESDSDDPEMKRGISPMARKKLQVANKNGLGSLESLPGLVVSIETEMAMGQLKERHSQEVQDLKIELETKVNFYERSLELMRQNMEVERKDISQGFKVEISDLEEQKAQVEEQVKRLREEVEKLQAQLQRSSGGLGGPGWGTDQERRAQREQAELEQNYAREISNLVQRLTSEKDQLEAELKLRMDQEVLLVRKEAEQQVSQMKTQQAQHSLMHQLRCECLQEPEQERHRERLHSTERVSEEQARICSRAAVERKRLEEEHQEEVLQLKEHTASLQKQADLASESHIQHSQSEAKLEETCGQCSQLQARLEVVCAQLEESTVSLAFHETLTERLTSEQQAVEELGLVRDRERALFSEVSQLSEELCILRSESETLLQDKETLAENCSRLSSAFIQQQVQLRAKEEDTATLRGELETARVALRNEFEQRSRQSAEMVSLKTDRAKLKEELRKRTTTIDRLQSDLDCVTEELDQWKRAEENLQEALRQERTKVTQIQSTLDREREETDSLSQENANYIRLADQLSNQIVEMETESSKLRDHIQELKAQLSETFNLVSNLRAQLEAKSTEVHHLVSDMKQMAGLLEMAEALSNKHYREKELRNTQLETKESELHSLRGKAGRIVQLQQALLSSRAEVHGLEEAFEKEKGRMKEQLVEMEKLVMALEMVMDPASPHRSQLDKVNCENSALKDRLAMLQQDVQKLEVEIIQKKKKLDKVEQEHEKNREEQERHCKENAKYREELLDMSARNLQLSNENSELSSRLRGDQGAVQMLTERLAQVSQEQEEGAAAARQLQETSTQQERERFHLQAAWQHDKELLERELNTTKEKLQRLSEVESSLTSLTLKHQWLEQDKERLLREAEERTHKVEMLQDSLRSVDSQTELLRSKLQAVGQVKTDQDQEVANHQRMLQEAQDKVKELEASMGRLSREKEQLRLAQKHHEEEATMALQEECQSLRLRNQELLNEVCQLQGQDFEVQSLTQECLTMKSKQAQLEAAWAEAQDQALRAETALTLAQVQHAQQLQQFREQAGLGSREQLAHLQAQLAEERRRGQQLEETLRTQAQQASAQMGLQQEQYEKVMGDMQERMEEVETKLRSVRMILQEKVNQLKEQLAKNAKLDIMLKDLYVENSQLMKALQVTEQRQKTAEKKNFILEEKITALNKLLRKIAPASLSA
ncbi:ninein-like protein isoform X1 [Oncorhynchus mykiss]|uniref:EF-hand domain-containing protein n=1 Tax=Oncorhynchus mykiss TaxID=8022 RepID=A0A8K9V3A6_ONCMY|nr:ninein-like protein isoform X1 [Oncorhynchus mykiss]XP_036815823.1 ninein-like protein isoform X1 [Oncorhynchus mykiss]